MKLIILLFLGYSVYKIVHFLLPIFKMKSKLNQQETKADFRRKVSNMDIQDAEYEDLSNLKSIYLFVQMIEVKRVQEKVVVPVGVWI